MEKGCGFKGFIAFCMILVLGIVGTSGCGSKEEEVLEEVELTDTVRWFNASYAILTETNNWDYNLFGGLANTETNQKTVRKFLDERWGITDWDSADETLEWIRDKGHRSEFARIVKTLERDGMSSIPEAEWRPF